MAREEARARVIEDGTTRVNAEVIEGTTYDELTVHDEDVYDAVNAVPLGGNLDPYFYTSKTAIVLGDTETELVTLTFDGVLQSVNINFDRTDVEVVLYVDSLEVFRADLADLNDSAIYDMGIPNQAGGASPGFIGVSNSGKHLQMALDSKVETNIELKAKRTSANTTNMKGIIVFYREYP
jgi:hypothetical protein